MGNRRRKPTPPNRNRIFLCLFLLSIPSLILFLHLSSSLLRGANALGRRCMPEYSTLRRNIPTRNLRIAMVSLSSEEEREDGMSLRRSFKGMAELVSGNKIKYANKKGYDFIDARFLVDPGRPPNWSKILAVRFYLGEYDWVFWNDADTIVTNPEISLENILEAAIGHMNFEASPDLVVTEDINGVNSGVFFVRQSDWSKNFLDVWWNQTSFIQFGSTKSGDNAAMYYLIDNLLPEEMQAHVRISPMQCLFNSYPWSPTWRSIYRLVLSPQTIWRGTYSKGDFMVHLAGFDKKREWAAKILQEIRVDN